MLYVDVQVCARPLMNADCPLNARYNPLLLFLLFLLFHVTWLNYLMIVIFPVLLYFTFELPLDSLEMVFILVFLPAQKHAISILICRICTHKDGGVIQV
jgi:hypothetical protein